MLSVAALGGSSRYDAIQLAALRPLSVVFLAYGILLYRPGMVIADRRVLSFLLLWALWLLIQLVPLPPAMWHLLPGREVVVELDRLVGLESVWRPISFVPTRGWNALASMVLPIAAVTLVIVLNANKRILLLFVALLALANAAVALLQIAFGSGSALYMYRPTNVGAPVGLFANENHSAMFSALGMLISGYLIGSSRTLREPPLLNVGYASLFFFSLLAVFAGGSRFGFAAALFAAPVAILLIFLPSAEGRHAARKSRNGEMGNWLVERPRLLIAVSGIILLSVFGAFYASDELPGLNSLFNENVFEDVRWQTWPILAEMIKRYWIFGIGFGSFEEVYYIFEPTELMLSAYLNQAHNDLAQVLIEGGAPAAMLIAWLAAMIVGRLREIGANRDAGTRELLFWLAALALVVAASLVDYPLRTPIFQVSLAFMLISLFADVSHGRSVKKKRRQSKITRH